MKVSFAAILILCLTQLYGQNNEVRIKQFNLKKGIAIEGYDPVSYFNGTPLEGNNNFKASYKGITYLFASKINLEKFKLNPDKYEPAYGGWCAFAMGETGEKVKIDPETFKILEGKLYLFYNFWGNNTLNDWNKQEEQLKAAGNKNWNRFIR